MEAAALPGQPPSLFGICLPLPEALGEPELGAGKQALRGDVPPRCREDAAQDAHGSSFSAGALAAGASADRRWPRADRAEWKRF
jgi:hypothetical protein